MKKDEFLKELCEILQRDEPLSAQMALSDVDEWDSLAYLSVMSFFSQHFGIRLAPQSLKQCQSVQDVIKLANGAISE